MSRNWSSARRPRADSAAMAHYIPRNTRRPGDGDARGTRRRSRRSVPSHEELAAMTAAVPTVVRPRSRQRALALPALVAAPGFLLVAALLSTANRSALLTWGWTPLDHHGVPWPSSLALLPGGWLQTLSFAGTGAFLVALAVALPRGGRSRLLAACGAGLSAAAFPLDAPVGDPGAMGSWIS